MLPRHPGQEARQTEYRLIEGRILIKDGKGGITLSYYAKVFVCDKPDYKLLFSTKQGSMVLLKEETLRAIETGDLSAEDEKNLTMTGLITDDQKKEKKKVAGFLDRMNSESKTLSLLVVLTLDCNFACPYCFENGIRGRHYMTDTTEDDLVDFVTNKLPGKEELIVDFYGGEPMLNVDRIKSISLQLQGACNKMQVVYSFNLTTNGSLLTRLVARELVSYGLEHAKITMDGPRDVHNQSRPFKSGAGSFDVIMDNVRAVCDIVEIGIGGNYSRENYHRFPELVDWMVEHNLGPGKIKAVSFNPIVNDGGYRGGCSTYSDAWIIDADLLLQEKTLEHGYLTSLPRPVNCVVENKNSCVVNWDGDICKCPTFMGKKKFKIGNVRTGVDKDISAYNLDCWKNREECVDCTYLPLCRGGCRYIALLQDGHVKNVGCRKKFFDVWIEKVLKLHVKCLGH